MAIQVNGTTVINDSRALNNITSADAATVAALGTAGVGGSTTNLGDTSLSGTPTSFDVSLDSGYEKHHIHVSGLTGNDYSAGLQIQMANSSGSIITSVGNYIWSYFEAPNYASGGTGSAYVNVVNNGVYNTTYPGVLDVVIVGARESGKRTIGFFQYYESNGSKISIGGFSMSTVQENTKLRIAVRNTSYRLAFQSGAYYKKYGVK
jgi:hypothetical protein